MTRTKKNPPAALDITYMYVLSGAVFFVSALLAGWSLARLLSPQVSAEPTEDAQKLADEPCIRRSLLNGACSDGQPDMMFIAAVMIDNHPSARPQSGLSQAAVVYEAPVEGNYTRFLALYPDSAQVKQVGPVRSARPYFADFAEQWEDVLYMHVGGSPEALEMLDSRPMAHVDEMTRDWYYWRSNHGETAPHNTYTSSDLWLKAWRDYGQPSNSNFSAWSFASTTPRCESDCVSAVRIDYLRPWFSVEWKYASTTGRYARFQADEAHTDRDGSPIFADTIIIQKTSIRTIDEVGRKWIDTDSGGEALIISRGTATEAIWEKRGGRTLWFEKDGEPLDLPSGVIWIEVVSPATPLTLDIL